MPSFRDEKFTDGAFGTYKERERKTYLYGSKMVHLVNLCFQVKFSSINSNQHCFLCQNNNQNTSKLISMLFFYLIYFANI